MSKSLPPDKKDGRPEGRRGWVPALLWTATPVVILLLFWLFGGLSGPGPKEISWSDFSGRMLVHHEVDSIDVVNNEDADIYVKSADRIAYPVAKYRVHIGSVEQLQKKLDEVEQGVPADRRIRLNFSKKSGPLSGIWGWIIPLVVFMFALRLMTRAGDGGYGGSAFNFGKTTAVLQKNDGVSNVSFKDVAGLEEAKQEVREIVDFLKSPGTYTRLGAKIPRGVILVGSPGTGKTLLARAVAGETGVPFFSLSGSEFVEMFVGVGASRVRDLFRKAKEQSPSIIFIDEIDAIGRSRGRNAFYTGSNDERESTLNQLLTEMDGFGTNSGVIVLAATNRGDMLDPALLRPGRFDRHIYLELPELKEREAIFGVHMRPLRLKEGAVEAALLAAQTPGFSGADIANICNEAALFAARRKSDWVEKSDFMDAIDRIVAGLEKKSKIISPEEKKVIAYHEAGHALVSWMLKDVDPLIKVSIIPRGRSLGAAWYLPEEHQLRTAAAFADGLCAALGGRAAEEVVFNEVSSGAVDDLEKVTKEAYRMVAFYGFDKRIGNVSFFDSSNGQDNPFQKPYSEETGRMIDEEVRQVIGEAYLKAKELLKAHREPLDRLAGLLLRKEVVYKEDLEAILGPRGNSEDHQTV